LSDAVERILPECKGIGSGIHLCLNDASAISDKDKVSSIVDSQGRFRYMGIKGFLFLMSCANNKRVRDAVKGEINEQIEKLLAFTGLDHLNAHMHVHMIPWIFDLCMKACARYKINYIRTTNEIINRDSLKKRVPGFLNIVHFLNLKSNSRKVRHKYRGILKTNDYFIGLLHSGNMFEDIALGGLRELALLKDATVEMLFHPAVMGQLKDRTYREFYEPALRRFIEDKKRSQELEALKSKQIKTAISLYGFSLTNYAKIS